MKILKSLVVPSFLHSTWKNRIVILIVFKCPKIKKEKRVKFLILVKTVQGWHASLTVCIQDKSAF